MTSAPKHPYTGHRFPPELLSHTVCLVNALVFWLVGGVNTDQIATRPIPTGGIRRSLRNALTSFLITGLVSRLGNGGFAYLQHYSLRFLLWRNDYAPWNYIGFLDYAAERVFLRKVGGGYIFTHRLLMEYFASLEPTKQAGRAKAE
jgi:hypothetical protein